MIESFQNPKIKNLIRLTTDNRFRKKQKAFIVEGQQENERALKFNFKAIELDNSLMNISYEKYRNEVVKIRKGKK